MPTLSLAQMLDGKDERAKQYTMKRLAAEKDMKKAAQDGENVAYRLPYINGEELDWFVVEHSNPDEFIEDYPHVGVVHYDF